MICKCTYAFEVANMAVRNIYDSCDFIERYKDKLSQEQTDVIGERICMIEESVQLLYAYIERLKRVAVAKNATTTSEEENNV